MGISKKQKQYGRTSYDDVPKVLQTDTERVLTRKKCLAIMGNNLPSSVGYFDRRINNMHQTTSASDNGLTTKRIFVGGGQHDIDVKPLFSGSVYSVQDVANAELEVAIMCTAFVIDFNKHKPPTDDVFNVIFEMENKENNNSSYQNGFEDLKNRGLRGYIRYQASVKQVWFDTGSPDETQFIETNSDFDSDVVGISVGEHKDGGPQRGSDVGYIFREIDFLSIHGFNSNMGLHSYNMGIKTGVLTDEFIFGKAESAGNITGSSRSGYSTKEGYMGIDPVADSTDLLIQNQPNIIHTIPIKLNPHRFCPKKPFTVEIKAFIYIPDNNHDLDNNECLSRNKNYPFAFVPYGLNDIERNKLDRPSEFGVTLDGRVLERTETQADAFWLRTRDLVYNVHGLTLWGSHK